MLSPMKVEVTLSASDFHPDRCVMVRRPQEGP